MNQRAAIITVIERLVDDPDPKIQRALDILRNRAEVLRLRYQKFAKANPAFKGDPDSLELGINATVLSQGSLKIEDLMRAAHYQTDDNIVEAIRLLGRSVQYQLREINKLKDRTPSEPSASCEPPVEMAIKAIESFRDGFGFKDDDWDPDTYAPELALFKVLPKLKATLSKQPKTKKKDPTLCPK